MSSPILSINGQVVVLEASSLGGEEMMAGQADVHAPPVPVDRSDRNTPHVNGMEVGIHVTMADGTRVTGSIAGSLHVERVWVFNGAHVWTVRAGDRGVVLGPEMSVGDGPLWNPGETFTVVVQIRDAGGHVHLLRSPSTTIGYTA